MKMSTTITASKNRRDHPYRKAGRQPQQHTDTGLPDMKPVILIFFHIFRTRDPDLS